MSTTLNNPLKRVDVNARTCPISIATPYISDVARIYEPDVNLVVLERPYDDALALAASSLPVGTTLELRTPPMAIGDVLRARLPTEAAPLADDAGRWAEVLADLLGARELGVRLTVADGPTCPAFHVDRVTVRLITAWIGAGSDVLAEEDLDRGGLGYWARGETAETSGLLLPGAQPRSLPPQSVGLFKGEAWPGNEGRGVVHRSPSVPPGGRRALFTLDVLR